MSPAIFCILSVIKTANVRILYNLGCRGREGGREGRRKLFIDLYLNMWSVIS